jgi:hypothetical protein
VPGERFRRSVPVPSDVRQIVTRLASELLGTDHNKKIRSNRNRSVDFQMPSRPESVLTWAERREDTERFRPDRIFLFLSRSQGLPRIHNTRMSAMPLSFPRTV